MFTLSTVILAFVAGTFLGMLLFGIALFALLVMRGNQIEAEAAAARQKAWDECMENVPDMLQNGPILA